MPVSRSRVAAAAAAAGSELLAAAPPPPPSPPCAAQASGGAARVCALAPSGPSVIGGSSTSRGGDIVAMYGCDAASVSRLASGESRSEELPESCPHDWPLDPGAAEPCRRAGWKGVAASRGGAAAAAAAASCRSAAESCASVQDSDMAMHAARATSLQCRWS